MDGIKGGLVLFRLDNKWLSLESFKYLVTNTWNNTHVQGSISYRIVVKLKTLKQEIKNWARDKGRKEEESITDFIFEIDVLDREEENGNLTTLERERKCHLKADLAKKLQMEATSWKQKLRAKGLKDGDKNSKYFHMLANHRRRVNYVEGLDIEGKCIKGNEALRAGAKVHFRKLYKESTNYRPKLDNLFFNSLDEVQKNQLEEEFS